MIIGIGRYYIIAEHTLGGHLKALDANFPSAQLSSLESFATRTYGPLQMARVGPEAVERGLEPGDRVTLQYLLGSVTNVTRDTGLK